jgi:hypothetical protein
VAAGTEQRDKVERLCRYIARQAIASGRLALTGQGDIRYKLKTPYRDGTTHVIFEPLDFMARLAALVPKPRVHLTRYHGVFTPHRRWRAEVTAARRGGGKSPGEIKSPTEKHRAMTGAQRLKRVFRIDIERCARCGRKLKIIANIEDPALIGRILPHRELHSTSSARCRAHHRPEPSGSPKIGPLFVLYFGVA